MPTYELRQWLKQNKHIRSPWGEKLDSNGYSKSLLESTYCFICGKGGDLARHEVFGGADRQTSKAVGMWCTLCPECHSFVHEHGITEMTLMNEAQEVFEEVHSHEEFMGLYNKNYL